MYIKEHGECVTFDENEFLYFTSRWATYIYEAYNLKIISQYDICLKGTNGDCNLHLPYVGKVALNFLNSWQKVN
jgi:hypothetical protein